MKRIIDRLRTMWTRWRISKCLWIHSSERKRIAEQMDLNHVYYLENKTGLYDLTAIFGHGNEPSNKAMNRILKKFNSYCSKKSYL
jgi:hypothetical protein